MSIRDVNTRTYEAIIIVDRVAEVMAKGAIYPTAALEQACEHLQSRHFLGTDPSQEERDLVEATVKYLRSNMA